MKKKILQNYSFFNKYKWYKYIKCPMVFLNEKYFSRLKFKFYVSHSEHLLKPPKIFSFAKLEIRP